MKITPNGYNICVVELAGEITPGVETTIGTKAEYERLRSIAEKAGQFIVKCKIVGSQGFGGSCLANLYPDGIDFGCVCNVGHTPTLVVGTIEVVGEACKVTLTVKTVE